MKETEEFRSGARRVATVAAALCLGLGLLGLAGWQWDVPWLMSGHPALVPVHPHAAVAFVLAAAGFLAQQFGFLRCGLGCGAALAGLGLVFFGQRWLDVAVLLPIEPLIAASVTRAVGTPSTHTALCFLLAGVALMVLAGARSWRGALGLVTVCAAVILAEAFVSGASFLAGMSQPSGLGWVARMSAMAVAGFALFGLALLATTFAAAKLAERATHLLLGSVTGVVTASVLFWLVLDLREERLLRRQLREEAAEARIELAARFKERVLLLTRLAARWEQFGPPTQAVWESDASLMVSHYPGIHAIEWVGPGMRVRWVVPQAGHEGGHAGVVEADPVVREALLRSRERREPLATPPLELAHGGRGFLVCAPIFVRGEFHGHIVGVFRVREFLDLVLPDHVADGHAVEVFHRNEKLYERLKEEPLKIDLAHEHDVQANGLNWRVRVRPLPAALVATRPVITEAIVTGGLLVAGLLALSFRMTRAAQAQTRLAEEGDLRLQRNHAELKMIFDTVPALVFYKDREGRFVQVNRELAKVVGLPPHEFIGKTDAELGSPFAQQHRDSDLRIMTTGEPMRSQMERLHTFAGTRWIQTDKLPLRDKAEQVIGVVGFAQDITDRKEAEDALRTSEQRFREMAENIREVFWMTDLAKNQMIYISPGYETIWGRTCESLYASPKAWAAAIHQQDRERVWQSALTNQVNGTYDEVYRILRPDGRERWVRDRAFPIRDERGEVHRVVGVAEDITERQQAEETLRQSEELNRRMLASSRDCIKVLDLEGRLISMNQHGQEAMEVCDFEPLLHAGWPDFWPVEAQEAARNAVATARDGGTARFQGFCPTAKGTPKWWDVLVTPILDADGKPELLLSSSRDITEQRNSDTALRESEERLETVVENISEGLVVSDLDGNLLHWNRAALAMLGFSSLAEVRRRVTEFADILELSTLEGAVLGVEQWPLSRVIRGEQLGECVLHIRRRDTDLDRVLNCAGAMVRDASGRQLAFVTFTDVTERTRVVATLAAERASLAERVEARTADLSRANAELARAARLKDEFLANMSHELRTPLHAVLGMSEALIEQIHGPLNERQQKYLTNVSTSGRHLLTLINDILDLSKIGAGKFELVVDTVPVTALCRASLQFVREAALQKDIRLSSRVDPRIETLLGDERRLKQILVNLLSNAIKFTIEHGEVGLDVEGDVERETIHFTVWDTGIGISPDDQMKLFQPFVQLDSGLARAHGGTGLGLALVWRMTEMHSGSVSVTSTPGQGSRFTVSLPWPVARNTASPAAAGEEANGGAEAHAITGRNATSPPSAAGGTGTGETEFCAARDPLVLLAEDNEANILTLSDYLQAKGCRLIIARNGHQAVAQTQAQRPDLVLMDIQMPVMDGLEAIRELRANADTRAVPIIALTALAMSGDRERCLAAGADEYVTKPFVLRELLVTMAALLRRKHPL